MSELGVADALIRQTQFEYDERGLRTKLTFDGKNITYVYDAKGRLISMTDWDSRTTTYDYDDVNRHRLTSRQNGVTSAYTHNTAGQLTDIHHKNSSNATLAHFAYTLNGRGHRTQANETLNGVDKTLTYSYDQLARVKNAKYYSGTTPTGTPADEYGYTFDMAGNRLSESYSVNGGTPSVTNYLYNSANQIDGYTYDNNGNLTNNGVSSYTWDRANRLTSVGNTLNGFTNYAYDGIGNRLSKTIGATITEYLVDMQPSLAVVLREKIGLQNTHYVHGLRGVLSQVTNSAWTEAMSDGLGSVRGWLNGSQAFVSDVDYNPYGVPSGTVDDFGFTGEMTDDNGLVYLRARYYDPNIGNFASLDPFEGFDANPMSLNGYSWVQGNVANWGDSTGMQPQPPAPPIPWDDILQEITSSNLDEAIWGEAIHQALQRRGIIPTPTLVTQGLIRLSVASVFASALIPVQQPNGLVCNAWDYQLGLCDPVWDNPATYERIFPQLQLIVPYVDTGHSCAPIPTPMIVPLLPANQNATLLSQLTNRNDGQHSFIRVRHYSDAINLIKSSRSIGAPDTFLIFAEYPISTPRQSPDLENQYSIFRPGRILNGIVEFNVDTNKYLIEPDSNFAHLQFNNAIQIWLFHPPTSMGNISYVATGFPLSEPNVEPQFFDKYGQPL